FRWLNAHHHYHHLYPFKNLNVVLPLADWVMGTLVPLPAKNPEFEPKKVQAAESFEKGRNEKGEVVRREKPFFSLLHDYQPISPSCQGPRVGSPSPLYHQ